MKKLNFLHFGKLPTETCYLKNTNKCSFQSTPAWRNEVNSLKMGLTIDSRKAVFKHVSELQAKVKYDQ